MIIEPLEVLYLALVTLAIGYIFMDLVPVSKPIYSLYKKFDWNRFKFACLIAAPGIILHELGHKFVAIYFGFNAVFEIWGFGLVLGIFLKAIGSGFILFAPGYVLINGVTNYAQEFFISFAGPIVNLILFGASWLLLNRLKLTRNQAIGLYLMKQINLWLFIFNMIPIPPLDGSKVFYSLFKLIF